MQLAPKGAHYIADISVGEDVVRGFSPDVERDECNSYLRGAHYIANISVGEDVVRGFSPDVERDECNFAPKGAHYIADIKSEENRRIKKSIFFFDFSKKCDILKVRL